MLKLFLKNKILFLLFILYFLTRLLNLGILPIFNDESTYIRFGLHNILDDKGGFYSLMIGKEPLTPYLFAVSGMAFQNVLIGARVVSVLVGFLTLIGLYKFCKFQFDKKIAYIVCLFYILSPFTLFFDRLALMDSFVSAVSIWTLYFFVKFLSTQKNKYAIYLGLIMGIGMWIKATCAFYVFLPILYLCYLILYRKITFQKIKKVFISLCIALLIFLPLYLQPLYRTHETLLTQYTYPLTSLFSVSFLVRGNNLLNAFTWIIMYLPFPLFVLSIIGIAYSIKNKQNLILFFWLLIPLAYMILFAKLFTERHVLMLTIPLIICAGYGTNIMFLKFKRFTEVLFVLTVAICLFYNYFIWFSPQKFPYMFPFNSGNTLKQYSEGNSSGYAVEEAIDYIRELRSNREIIVVTRNDFGNPEDAVHMHLTYDKDFRGRLFAWNLLEESLVLFKTVNSDPVYFVTRGNAYGDIEKYIMDEKRFYKPDGKNYIGVSQIDMSKF